MTHGGQALLCHFCWFVKNVYMDRGLVRVDMGEEHGKDFNKGKIAPF